MTQYIDKSALVAEIEKELNTTKKNIQLNMSMVKNML